MRSGNSIDRSIKRDCSYVVTKCVACELQPQHTKKANWRLSISIEAKIVYDFANGIHREPVIVYMVAFIFCVDFIECFVVFVQQKVNKSKKTIKCKKINNAKND